MGKLLGPAFTSDLVDLATKEAESGREYIAIAGALRTVIVQKGKLPRGQWPKVAKETIDSLKELHRWKNEKEPDKNMPESLVKELLEMCPEA